MLIKSRKILKYKDLKNIPAGENGEKLVILNRLYPELICRYQKKDMLKYLGNNILVRRKLADKLNRANIQLRKIRPGSYLKIVYGYRHPLVQEKYFARVCRQLLKENKDLAADKLFSLAHNLVALPDVAGHSVGGAVDVTIEEDGRDLDMGTKIADFKKLDKIKTYSRLITKQQAANRRLLHDLLLRQGFAPFYGEWWHFSYGDKEWACFYNKRRSLYSQIEYTLK